MYKMLKRGTLGFFVLALVAIGFGCESITETNLNNDELAIEALQDGAVIPGRYIVTLGTEGEKAKLEGINYVQEFRDAVLEATNIDRSLITSEYNTALHGFAANLTEAQLNGLREDSRVISIEPDRMIVLAPPCGTPRGGPCPPPDDGDGDDGDDGDGGDGSIIDGAEVPWGINRVGGAVVYTGNRVAWVLDTGIQLNHPDLNVDGSRGLTVFTSGPDANGPDDRNGHGTHVAGTIAAFNNIAGVAAGATVIPVKVLDRRGSGSVSGVIQGVDFVAANASAGDVANMSLGGGVSSALDNAVVNAASKGILFALAAGNSGALASNSSPARVDHPNTWTIAASDVNNNFASFSNYGHPTSYAAPGVSVKSTWISSGYSTISGTSMSAPHVAGILLVTGGSVKLDGLSSPAPNGVRYPIASHK
jgi:hypothetical protein